MKIFDKILLDIATGDVIETESFDYNGPVVLLKGGGGYVPPLPEPVKEEDPRVVEAQNEMRIRLKNMKGRSSTLLTGGTGVEQEALLKKPLLGGGSKA